MTRPESHREQEHERRCGNCNHCHYVKFVEHVLCFHGDDIKAERFGSGTFDKSFVRLLSEPEFHQDVELMDGDQLSRIWGNRSVDVSDVCDQWEERK
jgi:hypothetical protein